VAERRIERQNGSGAEPEVARIADVGKDGRGAEEILLDDALAVLLILSRMEQPVEE
jgi:hypothetical protein